MFEKCRCGSGLNYRGCCEPYIEGKKQKGLKNPYLNLQEAE